MIDEGNLEYQNKIYIRLFNSFTYFRFNMIYFHDTHIKLYTVYKVGDKVRDGYLTKNYEEEINKQLVDDSQNKRRVVNPKYTRSGSTEPIHIDAKQLTYNVVSFINESVSDTTPIVEKGYHMYLPIKIYNDEKSANSDKPHLQVKKINNDHFLFLILKNTDLQTQNYFQLVLQLNHNILSLWIKRFSDRYTAGTTLMIKENSSFDKNNHFLMDLKLQNKRKVMRLNEDHMIPIDLSNDVYVTILQENKVDIDKPFAIEDFSLSRELMSVRLGWVKNTLLW